MGGAPGPLPAGPLACVFLRILTIICTHPRHPHRRRRILDEGGFPSRALRALSGVDYITRKSLAHSGLAAIGSPHGPRRPAQAYFYYITISLSCTNDITVKLHRHSSQDLRPIARWRRSPDMANAPNQITLAQGVSCARVTGGVTDGGRTRDLQIHNLALRLLSYSHHSAVRIAPQTATTVV